MVSARPPPTRRVCTRRAFFSSIHQKSAPFPRFPSLSLDPGLGQLVGGSPARRPLIRRAAEPRVRFRFDFKPVLLFVHLLVKRKGEQVMHGVFCACKLFQDALNASLMLLRGNH